MPVPKNLADQANDEEKIRKAEDIIRQKKAAGEVIDFSINDKSMSESSVTSSSGSEIMEGEESDLEN